MEDGAGNWVKVRGKLGRVKSGREGWVVYDSYGVIAMLAGARKTWKMEQFRWL